METKNPQGKQVYDTIERLLTSADNERYFETGREGIYMNQAKEIAKNYLEKEEEPYQPLVNKVKAYNLI